METISPDRWTIARANAERAEALAAFGFTDRQARFLVQVLLHAGVFVERQYCDFANIVHGQKTTDFLTRIVDRRYATAISTGPLHRGRLFHVHYKPLWSAIGEPDSRFRKPAAPGRLIERLMLLDAVLSDSTFVWLGSSRDKLRHFAGSLGDRVRPDELPRLVFGSGAAKTVRAFPDKLPIGIQPYAPPHVLLYLVTNPSPLDFRAFLLRHTTLLGALREWTLRLLVPKPLARVAPLYEQAAREHLATRLDPSSAEELAWFFRERQRRARQASDHACSVLKPAPLDVETLLAGPAERGAVHAAEPTSSADRRFRDDTRAFGAGRFAALYRAWLVEGDQVLWAARSVVVPDAVERGEGHVEVVVLSRQYLHLAPLVGLA
jgi:hypothetical protein